MMKPTLMLFVDPEDGQNLRYWSQRWNCSVAQIKDAILYTGSLEPRKIKNWIRKDDLRYHPLDGAKYLMKKTFEAIF